MDFERTGTWTKVTTNANGSATRAWVMNMHFALFHVHQVEVDKRNRPFKGGRGLNRNSSQKILDKKLDWELNSNTNPTVSLREWWYLLYAYDHFPPQYTIIIGAYVSRSICSFNWGFRGGLWPTVTERRMLVVAIHCNTIFKGYEKAQCLFMCPHTLILKHILKYSHYMMIIVRIFNSAPAEIVSAKTG